LKLQGTVLVWNVCYVVSSIRTRVTGIQRVFLTYSDTHLPVVLRMHPVKVSERSLCAHCSSDIFLTHRKRMAV